MRSLFKKDLFRYYGAKGESLMQKVLRPPELKYLALFRKANSFKVLPIKLYYTLKLKLMSYRTRIQIPARTEIGPGFYIGHSGRLIVHPEAKIGENVNVGTGVTIGFENRGRRRGAPTIKGNCWIGTNSVIVGKITIEEDVLIAPLTLVNFDVPAHSIVIGNPAKIIHRENATEGYIENKV